MNQKALKTLEYHKIIAQLTEYAASPLGKALCAALEPSSDLEEIRTWQQQTTDAVNRVRLKGTASFSGVRDIGDSLKRLEIGSSLSIPELLSISSLLTCAARAKAYGRHEDVDEENDDLADSLEPMFAALEPLTPLNQEIKRCILSEDEVADDASPGLSHVRRAMKLAADKIHTQLNSILNSNRTYLQDAVITMRDGRYCLPVKSEYKNQVPGMVHDQSATGSTLFIEPMAIVRLNNEIRELEIREQKEIEAVLADLSNQAAPHCEDLAIDMQLLAQLDFIFAKSALARHYRCSAPVFNDRGYIHIKDGRHPLLDPKTVVPISVWLGKDFDLLIVTGPNTGGKTVSLKTVGLFTLMGQAGLHIPAWEGSELAVFDQVFADIGDEQSIEQSLSTFSAHMVNIVEILKEADRHSLVLFDELGAGTDPVEGAALAIAVIQHVRRLGAKVAATTHYAELKTFAMTTAGVENASCEFDVETLAPTYRLLIGIPGKSNAFAISRRLGLPEDVIAAAQGQMSGESVRFEDILTQLEEKRQALEKREQEADRLLRQREEDARRAREFREQMERAKDNARSRGEAEAKRILRDARTAADQVFQELSEMRKAQAKAERMLNENEARAALRRTLNEAEEAVSRRDARQEPIPKPSRPIRAGDLVEIPGVKTPAEVVSVGKDGTLQLKAGILKMKAKVDEVRLIEDDERAARKKTPSVTIRQNADRALRASAARELDIRGMETLEAESVVENFISAAVMGKLETVTIIHGKGTGALRKAVHDILRRNKAVKSFRLGVYGEGESGVTVVTLK